MKRAALIVLLMVPTLARGQDAIVTAFHAGLRAGYLENYHNTEAICPTCGTYSNGKGSGYEVQLFGEVPFNFFRRLNLAFGLGVLDRGGNFGDAVGNIPNVLDPVTNTYLPLVTQGSYSASLPSIDIMGGVRIQPLARFAGYFGLQFHGDLPLGTSSTFVQTARIVSPSGVVFPESHTTVRTDSSGTIQGIQAAFGVSGTIGYELPISALFTASPELSYYLPLSNVESSYRWKVASVFAGIAIRWNRPSEFVPPAPAARPAPPPVVSREDANALAPKLAATSLATQPFHIIETTVTETFPILPYIFFDSASATLPGRFAQLTPEAASRFKESELPHRSLESYYQILNVIGSRLASNPTATLTINGTTDGKEVASDSSTEIALARADAVKQYLMSVWQIPGTRLMVTTSDAPHNPSSTQYAEGFEENRRVELSSANDQILKPIVHERFREESALPKSLPVQLSATSRIGVRQWALRIRSHGATVYETSGEGAPPASIDWQPTEGEIESLAHAMTPADSLEFVFSAVATNGAHSETRISVPASKSINPFELSRLSLIVFDFDQAAIDRQNQRMIAAFVAKSLYSSSTATITGSTDNLGELAHNQKLSEDRAFNVRDLILTDKSSANITSTKGVGPNLLYDNHLPEGRYYCRTVKVEVETPLESILKSEN